ncbi:hypothetical protein SLEP1_g41878 [Rubroshorea leprosula]|uniref:Uncharacterized protein n=1 Tax=Rubroshorea leprosula TaxID=152421 RepID=A0AAV5L9A9_9ROSI|nr:hypothetical protein SLEP1_g41878 [Rubroshorea leprosula]
MENHKEKALLEYEKHKKQNGEIQLPESSPASAEKETSSYQPSGIGRARRDAAARAMQGWHAQRFARYGLSSSQKREQHLKSIGLQKHKTQTSMELAVNAVRNEADKQLVTEVVDIGPPACWVKINECEAKDFFEVYALVPGLLREEIVSLPARIDPLLTSAVVSLHGRLFVHVHFEQGSL